ncbi:MAG TPA: DUF4143 domain-containing protein, partial [Clostridiales bacterium]|nr:DUF4143 domain-containing protein [Clostridiales bacterium]
NYIYEANRSSISNETNRSSVSSDSNISTNYDDIIDIMKIINSSSLRKSFTHIIAISSTPVTKEVEEQFNILPIYPLEFDEFLVATGNEWYIEVITTHYVSNKKVPEIVHKELLGLLNIYLQIGGMPSAINEYINMASLINIHEQHNYLISFYYDYSQTNIGESDTLKMKQVFDSIPLQLLKTNKKFQYNLIRKGTTYGMYKDAIDRLEDSHSIIRSYKISSSDLENLHGDFDNVFTEEKNREENNSSFKLYFPDAGILHTKISECIMKKHIDYKDIKLNEKSYKGIVIGQNELIDKALLENYVAQSLNNKGIAFGFWESDSMAKVDFLIRKEDDLIPVELHWNKNTRSKSISVLKQKYDFPYSIKLSAKNYGLTNKVKYIPYYAVFCL